MIYCCCSGTDSRPRGPNWMMVPPERSEGCLYIGLMENFLIDWAQSIGDTFSEIKSTCLVSQFPVAFIIIVIN